MTYSRELADRIREALTDEPSVREVRMFGGLSFMVNETLTVGANNSGDLLLRCDPEQGDDLLTETGAQRAEMDGRQMSEGWMVVPAEEVATQEDLNFWVGVALEYNDEVTRKRV